MKEIAEKEDVSVTEVVKQMLQYCVDEHKKNRGFNISDHFADVSEIVEAAHNAGVMTEEEYAVFQNSGYMGLYGGLKVDDI